MSDPQPAAGPAHAANARWQVDVFVFAGAAAIVLLSALMTPSDETLALFGVEIPTVCTIRRLTGLSCPGCGLTRSFAYMAHGSVVSAFRMNLLGPVLFTAVAGQIPWRAYRLWARPRVDAPRS